MIPAVSSYDGSLAMNMSSWWTFHFAWHAVYSNIDSMSQGDYNEAVRGGIVFG